VTPVDPARERTLGGIYAFSAYVLWGFMPLYFLTLAPMGPFEVVSWRILFSLVFCAILLTVLRAWGKLIAILRTPRLVLWTIVAGLLIYVNWQVFLISTLTGHVIEGSLGYFINPIVTVLLGVLVLKERLRVAQWVAIGIAAVAVGVIVVGYGAFPWIALTLAASFGTYGLVKKQIGPSVDAVSGLTLESLWLAPVAIVQAAASRRSAPPGARERRRVRTRSSRANRSAQVEADSHSEVISAASGSRRSTSGTIHWPSAAGGTPRTARAPAGVNEI